MDWPASSNSGLFVSSTPPGQASAAMFAQRQRLLESRRSRLRYWCGNNQIEALAVGKRLRTLQVMSRSRA
jgi:hypothetical protein